VRVVLRCTNKLLSLLGTRGLTLVEAPGEDDWYANLLWYDRRKCLLVVHAGTLFPVFVADVRAPELRPIGRRVVGLIEGALLEEGLPVDALGPLAADEVRLAKTASRQVLGVMNEIAFEGGWHVDHAGGLGNTKIDELNRRLRRGLNTKHGQYRQPLELVLEQLLQRR
jgi:Domain of unknown function (DUF6933)